ncbi:LLM class flavin-dependent oxidoreductase [Halobacillus amylolyticus]|uniref:LLM class flavin-dependent oxidoreductase n=1 Tax=Halobacillus amylolyticus TaxID=2932259 RepID=A0ABY4HCJ5_9BACI|nr:LLM class flavin-dependent oxidoreductase [Halobacillus amylolyticus]UOR12546.1 LLM class flavin-dependent oxidoreductase [Halobacillus amylolyticus]
MKLSVLDQSPISKGQTAEQALQQTIELAQWTESLGFKRYWVAEHHNTNGLAGSSPEVLISHIASRTSRIRIGSGGVLLPQYSPLKVAESFKVLQALFPGRIDLGLGRSPGGGKKTRAALTDGTDKPLSSFSRQVKELQGFLHGTIPKEHAYYGVSAKPHTSDNPDVWVLGLSERGARHAAINGTGFTFGHFINPDHAAETLKTYREKFKPTAGLKKPEVNACVFVVCADTSERAEELALSQDMWLLQVEKGLETRVPSISEVKGHTFTVKELEKIKRNRKRAIVGTPETVYRKLKQLSEAYQTDEFLLITNIFDFEAKKHSYKLLADYIANTLN